LARTEQYAFDGLSYDRSAHAFVASLPLRDKMELSIEDWTVKSKEDMPMTALETSNFYLIPYKSDFDY
jgi:hypothetical protein